MWLLCILRCNVTSSFSPQTAACHSQDPWWIPGQVSDHPPASSWLSQGPYAASSLAPENPQAENWKEVFNVHNHIKSCFALLSWQSKLLWKLTSSTCCSSLVLALVRVLTLSSSACRSSSTAKIKQIMYKETHHPIRPKIQKEFVKYS